MTSSPLRSIKSCCSEASSKAGFHSFLFWALFIGVERGLQLSGVLGTEKKSVSQWAECHMRCALPAGCAGASTGR